MFRHQSDRRRYGKLLEELENDYTKGNDDYPQTLVKAYHLLCEYKHYQPKFVPSDSSSSVAFVQKNKSMSRTSEKVKDDSWILKATCHECGEIGHIRPQCPLILEGNDNKADSPSKSKSKGKSRSRRKARRQLSLRPKLLKLTTRTSPAINLQATDLLTYISITLHLLRWISAT
jgi:hypothetical protein